MPQERRALSVSAWRAASSAVKDTLAFVSELASDSYGRPLTQFFPSCVHLRQSAVKLSRFMILSCHDSVDPFGTFA